MGLLIVIGWFGGAFAGEFLAIKLGASQTTGIAIGLAIFVLVPALLFGWAMHKRS